MVLFFYRLDRCSLTTQSCEALKAVLQSPNSHLRELNLSYNKLEISAVQQLCEGLTCPNCKLEGLDLSYNNLSHSGVKLLCGGLMNPDCKIKSIRFYSQLNYLFCSYISDQSYLWRAPTYWL